MNIFKDMPKTELHAHLNGCASREIIANLKALKLGSHSANSPCDGVEVVNSKSGEATSEYSYHVQNLDQGMDAAFKVFDLIHRLTDTIEAVRMLTREVLDDYASENTVYLELRTTPKKNKSFKSRAYVLAIVDEIGKAKHRHPKMTVSLLLSINRGRNVSEAVETVELWKSLKSEGHEDLIGIDVSGNPNKSIDAFLPLIKEIKEDGIKITIHVSEIAGKDEETIEFLKLHPDRIGHATYLLDNQVNRSLLLQHGIPIEICLTSNLKTNENDNTTEHHSKLLHNLQHPFVICTDDRGVFDTSLSKEYELVAKELDLSTTESLAIARLGIQYSFLPDDRKTELLRQFDEMVKPFLE